MNERIKAIALRAGIALVPNSNPISITGLTTDLEKFAEFLLDEAAEELCDITGADYQADLFDVFDL